MYLTVKQQLKHLSKVDLEVLYTRGAVDTPERIRIA